MRYLWSLLFLSLLQTDLSRYYCVKHQCKIVNLEFQILDACWKKSFVANFETSWTSHHIAYNSRICKRKQWNNKAQGTIVQGWITPLMYWWPIKPGQIHVQYCDPSSNIFPSNKTTASYRFIESHWKKTRLPATTAVVASAFLFIAWLNSWHISEYHQYHHSYWSEVSLCPYPADEWRTSLQLKHNSCFVLLRCGCHTGCSNHSSEFPSLDMNR